LASFLSSVQTHSPSSTMICLSEMPIKPSASIYSTFPDLASEIIKSRRNQPISRLSCLVARSPQQNGCRTFNFSLRMFSHYSLGKTWVAVAVKNEKNNMILHVLHAKDFGPASDDRLFRFPARQCKILADKKAMLSYKSCTAVNIYLKEVAEYLLRGDL
jgi:hypothetical protein